MALGQKQSLQRDPTWYQSFAVSSPLPPDRVPLLSHSPGTSPASAAPSVARAWSPPPWQTKMGRSTAKVATPRTSGPKALASGRGPGRSSTRSEAPGAGLCSPWAPAAQPWASTRSSELPHLLHPRLLLRGTSAFPCPDPALPEAAGAPLPPRVPGTGTQLAPTRSEARSVPLHVARPAGMSRAAPRHRAKE